MISARSGHITARPDLLTRRPARTSQREASPRDIKRHARDPQRSVARADVLECLDRHPYEIKLAALHRDDGLPALSIALLREGRMLGSTLFVNDDDLDTLARAIAAVRALRKAAA